MNSGLVLCPLDSAVASPRGRLAEEAVSPHYLQSEMYFQIEPCKKAVQASSPCTLKAWCIIRRKMVCPTRLFTVQLIGLPWTCIISQHLIKIDNVVTTNQKSLRCTNENSEGKLRIETVWTHSSYTKTERKAGRQGTRIGKYLRY